MPKGDEPGWQLQPRPEYDVKLLIHKKVKVGINMVCENCQKLANDVDLWKTKYKELLKGETEYYSKRELELLEDKKRQLDELY